MRSFRPQLQRRQFRRHGGARREFTVATGPGYPPRHDGGGRGRTERTGRADVVKLHAFGRQPAQPGRLIEGRTRATQFANVEIVNEDYDQIRFLAQVWSTVKLRILDMRPGMRRSPIRPPVSCGNFDVSQSKRSLRSSPLTDSDRLLPTLVTVSW